MAQTGRLNKSVYQMEREDVTAVELDGCYSQDVCDNKLSWNQL